MAVTTPTAGLGKPAESHGNDAIPPLEIGDRLNRAEFERRYERDKLRAYWRNGAREYLVWRVLDGQFDWFVLDEDRYEPLEPAADGTLRSRVFPGLWLDPGALMRGDLNAVFAIVQKGLNSPEHAGFLARLADARIA
jgi:hypothetical protein